MAKEAVVSTDLRHATIATSQFALLGISAFIRLQVSKRPDRLRKDLRGLSFA